MVAKAHDFLARVQAGKTTDEEQDSLDGLKAAMDADQDFATRFSRAKSQGERDRLLRKKQENDASAMNALGSIIGAMGLDLEGGEE